MRQSCLLSEHRDAVGRETALQPEDGRSRVCEDPRSPGFYVRQALSHGARLSDTVPGTIRRGTMGPAERTWVVTRDKTAKCDRD